MVPGGQSGPPRKQPDFILVKFRIEQWCKDAVFVRGPMPRAKIAEVGGVKSIGDGAKVPPPRDRLHLIEQFVLAVIAAIGTIRHVERVIEFASFDELMSQPGCLDEPFGLFAVVARETGRQRRDRKRAFAEHLMRSPRQIGGVGTARKRDQKRIDLVKGIEQKLLLLYRDTFLRGRCWGRGIGSDLRSPPTR